MHNNKHNTLRHLYYEYRSEVVFGLALIVAVVISYMLSPLIPSDIFRTIVTPVQNTAVITVTLINTWAMALHSDGIRVRRIYAWIMAAISVLIIGGLCYRYAVNAELRPTEGIFAFAGWELLAGDIIAWFLLAYPSELLRPGWLTWKNALTRILPVLVIGLIDWFAPWDLRWLLALVPLVWIVLLFRHVHAYRKYSEENFSSLEQTDERWIIRYLTMIAVLGLSYAYLYFSKEPNRLFTNQWLLFFIFVYTNDQVIFRSKPWIEDADKEAEEETETPQGEKHELSIETNDENRRVLEQWMETDKPYLNPNFRLTDLRQVLPMNRTYLSQFINTEYGCTFYQFVTNYRIREAQQLMTNHPEMKLADVAALAGFSSPVVFSRIFTKEMHMTPREWVAQTAQANKNV